MFTLHGKHPQTRPNWNCTAFYFIDYQPDQTKLDFVLEGQLESPIEDVAITTSLKVTPLFISTITVILGKTNLQLRALWDGGATDSLIQTSVANTHFSQYIEPTLKLLAGYSAESEERPQLTEGQIRPLLKINAKNKYITVKHSLLLTDLCNLYDVLIGRNLMKRLRAVEDYEKETITLSPMDDKVLRITPDPISRITSVSTVTDEQPEAESSTPSAQSNFMDFQGLKVDVGTLPLDHHQKFHDLLTEFSDVFSMPDDTTRLPPPSEFEHRIILKDSSKVHYVPPIPLPAPHKEWLRKIYDARVSSGCATVAVNCPYASRAFVIPKKAPGQYREVIDYRALNSNTIKDKFPLPRIDSLFDETLNSSIKSILDMVDGYYNYRMHPESAPYTAVIAPFGQYINHVMPQGLCNAPPFFQMANTARFSELIHTRKELLLYLDDLLVHTTDINSHFDALRRLFMLCRKHHLRLKLVKCYSPPVNAADNRRWSKFLTLTQKVQRCGSCLTTLEGGQNF